jgi:hypothetical protein
MSSKLLSQLDEVKALPVITLDQLVISLKDQGLVVLCLVTILPFMQPIPLPGISSILGLIILLQGFAMMFVQKPLLTKKMKDVVITHERFELIYRAAQKFTKYADKISVYQHPWTNSRASHFICGLAIVLSAAFLSLPLPIPFSNFVPALSIALICLGLLEEDLILIIMGLSISLAVSWMFFFSYHFLMDTITFF